MPRADAKPNFQASLVIEAEEFPGQGARYLARGQQSFQRLPPSGPGVAEGWVFWDRKRQARHPVAGTAAVKILAKQGPTKLLNSLPKVTKDLASGYHSTASTLRLVQLQESPMQKWHAAGGFHYPQIT